jgi:hypothetical protein
LPPVRLAARPHLKNRRNASPARSTGRQNSRATVEGAAVLVVRHPDGGFRRFEVSQDGQNLLAADGAEVTQSALKADRWEVILGDNRYVIPVKADAPRE